MRVGIDYTAAARQRAGIGRYTRELVAALLGRHPQDYVIFAAEGKRADAVEGWRTSLARETVRIRALPLSDEWMARLWHRLRLPLPVETVTGPLDLFYSPDFTLPPTRPATCTLLTVHDLSFLRYPDHFVPKLVRYLSRVVPRSVARADHVLADSQATRADLIARMGVPPEKVSVLYSGVDERFCPQATPGEEARIRARYGLRERPYVLSVGTLQPRKNYVRLIEAFAQAAGDAQLVIAGGRGWLYEPILEAAERQGERVVLAGFVADEDLPALYRHARAFAFPSLYEGFGLPVLEAMACGAPVVCSDASSLPEVAGDAALLVDPLDVDALAEALVRVQANDALRQQMVDRGLAQAARFTWTRAADQLWETMARFGAEG